MQRIKVNVQTGVQKNQLDKIYHEGIDAWKETISAVKAEYPKGV
jgi:hypothetical protein